MQQRGPEFNRPADAGPEIGPYEPKLPPEPASKPTLRSRLKALFSGPSPRPGFTAPRGWRTTVARVRDDRRARRRAKQAKSKGRPDDFRWP